MRPTLAAPESRYGYPCVTRVTSRKSTRALLRDPDPDQGGSGPYPYGYLHMDILEVSINRGY